MKRYKFSFGLIALLLLLVFTSCKPDEPEPTPEDYSAMLNNTGENVIVKTYADLGEKATTLQTACTALENDPTSANLDAARDAWVAARSPWEQSEGFLFGPVDQDGLDPALDSWPVNVTDLDNVLASSNNLTVSFLHQQEGTLKGFHTVEYLLWGTDGNKQVSDFTMREFEYLAAAAGALAEDANDLFALWDPNQGNFIENVLTAGNGSVVYISQKSALEEFANSLAVIADEVGNGKINEPFSQQDLSLEESRFSANSKQDFADNMRSIQNIYTGFYGTNGNGQSLSIIIAAENPDLDTRLRTEIQATIMAIENIPGTFSDAVFNSPSEVAAAQQAVRDLQDTLESELIPLISSL